MLAYIANVISNLFTKFVHNNNELTNKILFNNCSEPNFFKSKIISYKDSQKFRYNFKFFIIIPIVK